jgi:Phosphotransferase enzyme family
MSGERGTRMAGDGVESDGDIRHRDGLLRALGIEPEEVARANPMEGGLSGRRLVRLLLGRRTHSGTARWEIRVLKEVVAGESWLDEPENTARMPGVQMWTSSVMADLPASIATGVVGFAQEKGEPARGALLMRDVGTRLWPLPERKPPGALTSDVLALLDRLAQLHARFWDDERLRDPALQLLSVREALLLMAPERIAHHIERGNPALYLRLAAAGWERFFELARPEDAATLRAALAMPESWVQAISALPATLVHGDVWPPNLGWLPGTRVAPRRGRQALLLDWELATAGPATYDPLWLCGTWHDLNSAHVLAAYRARLERHLAARGHRLAGATWQALVDAGYLRTVLACGEAFGWSAEQAHGAARRRAIARARWWAQRGAQAARRLVRANDSGRQARA